MANLSISPFETLTFEWSDKAPVYETVDGEEYLGPTTIVPMAFTEQVLDTSNKLVKENIVVAEVSYAETSNTAGGKTVAIGE